jgi:hypothetical protein
VLFRTITKNVLATKVRASWWAKVWQKRLQIRRREFAYRLNLRQQPY